MSESLVNSVQPAETLRLLECVQVDENIVHPDSNDHERRYHIQNAHGLKLEGSIQGVGQREGGCYGEEAGHRCERREPGEDEHETEDQYKADPSQHGVVVDGLFDLVVEDERSSVQHLDFPGKGGEGREGEGRGGEGRRQMCVTYAHGRSILLTII